MAEFFLPKNSTIKGKGKHHKADGANRTKTFKIYRYDPDSGENPRYDTFAIDLDECGPMVLAALIIALTGPMVDPEDTHQEEAL